MGNKRSRRSRRLETPSPVREVEITRIETPKTGNEALIDLSNVAQGNLGENSPENQLTEPSQISNEMQVWTQIMEQKNNDRIEKMREEKENKLEAILKEIKSNKSASTLTNPKSHINEMRENHPSGSKLSKSIGVHASNNENSDSENDDYPLRASKIKDLKHPAKPFFETETDLDQTILSNEESEQEDYLNIMLTHYLHVLKLVSRFSNLFFSILEISGNTCALLFSQFLTFIGGINNFFEVQISRIGKKLTSLR